MRRKTHEEFLNDVGEKKNSYYTVRTEYVGAKKSITLTHNLCGHTFDTVADNFLRSKEGNCPKCSDTTKKNNNLFIEEVNKLVGDEYTFLEEYVNSRTKLKVRHNSTQCNNNEYYVRPNDFKSGKRCPMCNPSRIKTNEEFLSDIGGEVLSSYKFLTEYTGRHNKMEVEHTTCGHVYHVTAGNFLKGRRCPKCSLENLRLTNEEFNKRIIDVMGEEYELFGDYVNSKTNVYILHKPCGNVFSAPPNSVSNNFSRCLKCIPLLYKGEEFIKIYLDNNFIPYEQQKRFKGTDRLYYDFYLTEHNILIEYQGIHHYEPTTFGGITSGLANSNLKTQQVRDDKKRQYARKNNIPLLEPNYKLRSYESVKGYLEEYLKPLLEVTQGTLNQN